MLSIDLGIGLTSIAVASRTGAAASFDPASLFTGADAGIIYDFSAAANLAQASNGTTAVASAADPIGYVSDAGPSAKPATQATSASRPKWGGYPRTLGAEKTTDGQLSSGSAWTAGTGWTVTGGKAVKTAGTASTFSQAVTVSAAEPCMLFYCVVRTAGTLTARLTGGTAVADTDRTASGSYSTLLFPETGNTTLEFSADASFAGSVYAISLRPVSSWSAAGAWFDGSDDQLKSASVDLSATDKATVVFSGVYARQDGGSAVAIEVNNYFSSLTGSAALVYDAAPKLLARGNTAHVNVALPSAEGRSVTPVAHLNAVRLDFAQSTVATEIEMFGRGFKPTNAPTGTQAGTGPMGNGTVTLGSAANSFVYFRGLIRRVLVINRLLDDTELASATAWARGGQALCAVIGDSTSATNSAAYGLTNAVETACFVGGIISEGAMLATAGENIAQQKARWTALAGKSALQAVIVQIGLNDVLGRVAENIATTAQVIADLQDLITTINADKPAGCKTYIAQLTPCKLRLDGATNPTAAYAAWQAINEAIAGAGATPITGVDARITSHIAALNDGSDNLLPRYDHNADGVHLTNEARWIVAQAWQAQLEADGLAA